MQTDQIYSQYKLLNYYIVTLIFILLIYNIQKRDNI